MTRLLAILFAALAVAACGPSADTPETPRFEDPAPPELPFVLDTSAATRTPSGLHVKDLQVGTGEEATAGRRVAVLYTGWLTDGTRFDGNQPNGPTLPFTIAGGEVIPGWDEGVAGMRVGGRRQLVIPPHLAYGPVATGPIPANSTLVFEVELVGVQ